MSISEAERSYRRRLVYSAMPDGASSTTVQKSIAILENEFGDVGDLKYSQLIVRLQENLDQAELNIAELLGNIMELRKKSPSELRSDPNGAIDTLGKAEATSQSFVVRVEGRLKVFNMLFGTIAKDAAKRGNVAKFQAHMADKVESMSVTRICSSSLKAWAESDGASPSIGGGNSELHAVINEAFVWLCNTLGPVEADKVLLHAVRVADETPEAFECSARTFL